MHNRTSSEPPCGSDTAAWPEWSLATEKLEPTSVDVRERRRRVCVCVCVLRRELGKCENRARHRRVYK
jgi:hypothetical protein